MIHSTETTKTAKTQCSWREICEGSVSHAVSVKAVVWAWPFRAGINTSAWLDNVSNDLIPSEPGHTGAA